MGRWTGKHGELEGIDHARRGLEREACGSVAIIRSRPIAGGQIDAAFYGNWYAFVSGREFIIPLVTIPRCPESAPP
jgi:hypothetical protein